MHIKHVICGCLGLALASVPAAAAQNPKNEAVTLDAQPTILVYSGTATISGRVSGADTSAVTVRLEEDATRPYGDSYKPSNQTTATGSAGKYSFAVKPLQNTQYRAVAQTSPPVTSAAKLVLVRSLVGIKVSDPTPARGELVTFSGSVFPAQDGRTVLVQKRSPAGRFVTVARTTLRDAGTDHSTYQRRVRLFRDGAYRVKVPGDADHVNGFSTTRTLNVAGV
jgi:hypothetical protein